MVSAYISKKSPASLSLDLQTESSELISLMTQYILELEQKGKKSGIKYTAAKKLLDYLESPCLLPIAERNGLRAEQLRQLREGQLALCIIQDKSRQGIYLTPQGGIESRQATTPALRTSPPIIHSETARIIRNYERQKEYEHYT